MKSSMKRIVLFAGVAVMATLVTSGTYPLAMSSSSAYAASEDTAESLSEDGTRPQSVCPVRGGKIDREVYYDFQGQRVYFCCAMCIPTFKKDTEKYMARFAEENVVLDSIQTVCPVRGNKISKDAYVDYAGRRVYFCCAGCQPEFESDPQKYLKTLPGEEAESDQDHAHSHGMSHEE